MTYQNLGKKRRARERRRQQLREQRSQVDEASPRGTASDYMHQLPRLLELEENRPVVLLCRASTEGEMIDGNLHDAIDEAISDLRKLHIRLGHRLISIF